MKFEDALAQMRLGKKITHPDLGEDVYFQVCRVGFSFSNTSQEEWPISIVKMKGERQHQDMKPPFIQKDKQCRHGNFPQLNLFLVMSEDWELIE